MAGEACVAGRGEGRGSVQERAGGTHPTGMHSCFVMQLLKQEVCF